MLEITCQDSEVTVVPINGLRVIRVSDVLAGIIINIPMTATSLLELCSETAVAA